MHSKVFCVLAFSIKYELRNKKSNECEKERVRERGEDGGLPEGYRLAFVCAPGWRGCTPCWRTLASLRSRTRRGSCSHKGRTCLPHKTYNTNIKLLYFGNGSLNEVFKIQVFFTSHSSCVLDTAPSVTN